MSVVPWRDNLTVLFKIWSDQLSPAYRERYIQPLPKASSVLVEKKRYGNRGIRKAESAGAVENDRRMKNKRALRSMRTLIQMKIWKK